MNIFIQPLYVFNNNVRVPRAYRTATQKNKVKYERQLTNETYKVCHESRRTAGYVTAGSVVSSA